MPAGARGRTRKTRARANDGTGEPTCRVPFCYRCADHSKSPLTAKTHTRTHEGVDRRAARPCNQTCAPACTNTRTDGHPHTGARAVPNFIQTQRFERVLMQGSCDPSPGAFSCVLVRACVRAARARACLCARAYTNICVVYACLRTSNTHIRRPTSVKGHGVRMHTQTHKCGAHQTLSTSNQPHSRRKQARAHIFGRTQTRTHARAHAHAHAHAHTQVARMCSAPRAHASVTSMQTRAREVRRIHARRQAAPLRRCRGGASPPRSCCRCHR
jgi:hypothetical protein